jgi:hypothetical protein
MTEVVLTRDILLASIIEYVLSGSYLVSLRECIRRIGLKLQSCPHGFPLPAMKLALDLALDY